MRQLFIILILIIAISACTQVATTQKETSAVKEKSVSELVDEIHDLDTESTALYNNFDSDFTKFGDSASTATTLEALKTVQLYADRSKQSGKKALDSFNVLLSKISDIKKKSLSPAQKAYIDKLELATNSYKEIVKVNLEIVDKLTKTTSYSVHNSLFFDHYNNILQSLKKLQIFDKTQNWKSFEEEVKAMNKSLSLAREEVRLMKEQIPFKFLSNYNNFLVLMQEHIDKLMPLVEKRKAGKYISQEEINEADQPGYKALDIFKQDTDGTLLSEGEEDEVEAYIRDNISTLQDKSDEAFNKADAYYQDAKLRYEQLIKGTATS